MKKSHHVVVEGLICLIPNVIFLKTKFLSVKVLCLKLDVDPTINFWVESLFNIEKCL